MVEEEAVVDALRGVHDPEIPVNVYDLGLVYDIEIQDSAVEVEMTLTSPTCPIAGQMVAQAENAVEAVEGVETADVELVWDPPWSPEMATDEGRMQLQSMGVAVESPGTGNDSERDSQPSPDSPF